MKQYNKYLVNATDQFDPVYFSSVDDEIMAISEEANRFPSFFKTEILMSFLKGHPFEDNWVSANPGLTDMVNSGSLFKGSIESLFDSCRESPTFQKGLENYLQLRFTNNIL